MARPRKENADYFSHDTNMRSHRKVIALRNKYWLQWYAVYCMLLEHIAWSDYFVSKRDEIEQEILAGDFWIPVTELVDIVSFCDRLGLLQIENENMKCQSIVDRLQDLIIKRERERNRVSVAETTQVVAESPQSKVKESKVKEIKQNNNKEMVSKDTAIAEYGNQYLNTLESLIKNVCKENNILYSWKWQKERQALNWLLSKKMEDRLKELDMTLSDLIKTVIPISAKIKYWKTLSSAVLIYYNWEDIYNKAKKEFTENRSWVSKF